MTPTLVNSDSPHSASKTYYWAQIATLSVSAVTLVGMYILGIPLLKSLKASHQQYQYAIAHLAPNAFPPKQNPFPHDLNHLISTDYEDLDRDGLYENVLSWKIPHSINTEGTYVKIPFSKCPDGHVVFPTLSPIAVDPLHIPTPFRDDVQYRDVDGDRKLESIVKVGADYQHLKEFRLEQAPDGGYKLS